MTHDDLTTTIRRNKLLGIWAAEKLGLVGEGAEVYSNDLAAGALDAEGSDVFGKVRNDFKTAGLVLSDEDILSVMSEFWLQASSSRAQIKRSDSSDAATVQIARNLMSK